MKTRMLAIWASIKGAAATAYQWTVGLLRPAMAKVESVVVPPIHRFRMKQDQTPGDYTVSRSVGGFVGGYLGAMLALSGSMTSLAVVAAILATGGYFYSKAGKYQPETV